MNQEGQIKETPTLKFKFRLHRKPMRGLSFDCKGEKFATCSEDKSVVVQNLKDKKNDRAYSLKGHTDIVTAVEYANHDGILASCSYDQTVRIYEARLTGSSLQFRAHTSPIRTIAFSPQDDKIITGSNDKSIKLWSVPTKQFISSFTGHNNWVQHVAYSDDGDLIASCSDDKTTRLWDVNTAQSTHVFETKASPTHLSLHKSGNYLILAMNSGSVRMYDIRMKKLHQHYSLHDYTSCVCWHPRKICFASSGKDGKIHLVDPLQGRPLYTIHGHEGGVNYVRFNPQGDLLASTGLDLSIMVWEIHTSD